MLHRLRSERGQTAAEWLGVLVLISALVIAFSQTPIGKTLGDDIRATICKIAGGSCEPADGNYEAGIPPLSECVRDSSKRGIEGSVKILRFKLGAGVEGTKEIRADGSVRVSVKGNAKAGIDFSKPGASVDTGDGETGTGKAKIEANVNGAATYGWDFANEADADKFLGDVKKKVIAIADPLPNLPGTSDDADIKIPSPTIKTYEGGVQVSGEVTKGSAKLNGNIGAGGGVSFNDKTGEKTIFLEVKGGGTASAKEAGNPFGGGLDGSVRMAVTYDKDGKAKNVRMLGTVDVTGNFKLDEKTLRTGDLSDVINAANKDKGEVGGSAGGRLLLDANLDLTKLENKAAWDAFLGDVNPVTGVVSPGAVQLFDRFKDDSVFNAKVYGLSKTKTGGEVDIGIGGLGGSYSTEDAKIIAAWYRDKVNGGFTSWEDCVKGLAQ